MRRYHLRYGLNGYCSRTYNYRVLLTQNEDSNGQNAYISVVPKLFSFDRITVNLKAFAGDDYEESKMDNWLRRMPLVHARECAFCSTFGKLGLVPLRDI